MKNWNATALDEMTPAQIADLTPAELAGLVNDLDAADLVQDRRRLKMHEALTRKYAEQAQAQRRAAGKDTGTIRLADGDATVICGLSKKVKWDQVALRDVLAAMPEADARHYARVEIKIDERKFDAAPPAIRALLTHARTVEPAKPTFAIEIANAKSEAA
jgi:hypothetical protein